LVFKFWFERSLYISPYHHTIYFFNPKIIIIKAYTTHTDTDLFIFGSLKIERAKISSLVQLATPPLTKKKREREKNLFTLIGLEAQKKRTSGDHTPTYIMVLWSYTRITMTTKDTTTTVMENQYNCCSGNDHNHLLYCQSTGSSNTNTNSSSSSKSSNNHTSYRRINYHLLSQSKTRQQHLLRWYVRTNNLTRIQDYYTSIQNYHYHRQQRLVRTQQHQLRMPPQHHPRRMSQLFQWRRRNSRRNRQHGHDNNNNNNAVDDENQSIYIPIEQDCGGTWEDEDNNNNINDENDASSYDSVSDVDVEQETTGTTNVNLLPSRRVLMVSASLPSPNTTTLQPSSQLQQHQERRRDWNRSTITPLHPTHTNDVVAISLRNNTLVVASSPSSLSSPVYTMLDIDDSININETLHWTILYYACFHHRYAIVQYLIEECYASMKCTDRYHNTILHWICHYSLPSPPPPSTMTSTVEHNSHPLGELLRLQPLRRKQSNGTTSKPTTSTKKTKTASVEEVQLLLQYVMECNPSLLLIGNRSKELPIHWLCQYGNNNLILIQCMIEFLQTNPYFTSSSSSSWSVQQILQQQDQYHRTPLDVAHYYHNDQIVQYLQSFGQGR
jgi:hypothetical protein